MGKENLSQNEGLISRYKIILIVVAVASISYISIAMYMGNPRPFAVVSSESMLPVLAKGDIIIMKSSQTSSLSVGDIIVFDVPSPYDKLFPSPIIHRIIEKEVENGEEYFITKGDHNLVPDIFKLPAENVIGKYIGFKIPLVGHIVLFIQSPIGFGMTFTLIVIIFIYSYVERKKKQPKNPNQL